MPNVFKFSETSSEKSLRKGNFSIGVGDVPKGPSSDTGFYQGITPHVDGWMIYKKIDGDTLPFRIYSATQGSLVNIVNRIEGKTFSQIWECLNHYALTSSSVIVNKDFAPIVTDGLLFRMDVGNTTCYSTTSSVWYDLGVSSNSGNLNNGAFFNENGYFTTDGTNDTISISNLTSLNSITGTYSFTFCVLFKLPDFALQRQTDAENITSLLMKNSYNPSFGVSLRYDLPSSGVHTRVRIYNGLRNLSLPNTSPGYGMIQLTSTALSLNRWYQLDFVHSFSGTTHTLSNYINGVLNSTGNFTNNLYPISITNTGPVTVSSSPLGGNGIAAPINISSSSIYNKSLSLTEILNNYYQSAIVTDGLVFAIDAGNLPSYENGDTTAYSLIGNFTASLVNGASYNSTFGGGWSFDGTNDYISLSSDGLGDSFTSFSIEFVVKPSVGQGGNGIGYIIHRSTTTIIGTSVYAIYIGGSTLFFTINGAGHISIGSSANILAHYVYSWDGSVVRVYKNGNFVNSVNFSTFTNTVIGSTTNIGAVAADPTYRPLAQDFYLLRNYNRALSDSEIKQNYESTKWRFGL